MLRNFHVLVLFVFVLAVVGCLLWQPLVSAERAFEQSLRGAVIDDRPWSADSLIASSVEVPPAADQVPITAAPLAEEPKTVKASHELDKEPIPTEPATQPMQIIQSQLKVDWQKTQLGPGHPTIIDSAWSDMGVLKTGTVLRIEADGFNGENHAEAGWGWYLNVWSADGRHWTEHPEASRMLHLNPRPRAGMIAMNHCLGNGWGIKGGWAAEKDLQMPLPWKLENAAAPFVLELKLGPLAWSMKINGKLQAEMAYDRHGDFSKPLLLQLYDVLNPQVFLTSPEETDADWKQLPIDWQKTQLGPGHPTIIDSAWGDIGVPTSGDAWRIEADGFNGKDHAEAGWGWYFQVWSGDGRHWTEQPEASRLLHVNPRPRAGIIAMNHCLKGAWGPEKDVPMPSPWKLENSATAFKLDLELGPRAWSVTLNGKLQPEMGYDRKGDFSKPLTLQLYDLVNPRIYFRGSWGRLQLDWQDTQLGPGYPAIIASAWGNMGLLKTGSVLRIEGDGFNGKDHPNAAWGWYMNVWSGDGRHWTEHPQASRLLHLNPRPRGDIIAMNHCLKGAWGPEKDVPIPIPWKLENAAAPFVLELELGALAWSMKLNGKLQPEMSYDRQGDFSEPLTVQLYDILRPRVFVKP